MFDSLPSNDNSLVHDFSLPFLLERPNIRGRFVRLGDAAHRILSAHRYPLLVSQLLGEMLALATLLGTTLKIDGVLSVQAQGNGPVRFVVADYTSTGHLRGYAAIRDLSLLQEWSKTPETPRSTLDFFGVGFLSITVENAHSSEQYQGIIELSAQPLNELLTEYFRQSEQLDAQLIISVGRCLDGAQRKRWRVGGLMVQRLPAAAAKGPQDPTREAEREENWSRATMLLRTVTEAELTSVEERANNVLYKLFHEEQVRVFAPTHVVAKCRCSREKIAYALVQFQEEERERLYDKKGVIVAECQFCRRKESFVRDDFRDGHTVQENARGQDERQEFSTPPEER